MKIFLAFTKNDILLHRNPGILLGYKKNIAGNGLLLPTPQRVLPDCALQSTPGRDKIQ